MQKSIFSFLTPEERLDRMRIYLKKMNDSKGELNDYIEFVANIGQVLRASNICVSDPQKTA